jgi:hypothetical protein
MREKKPYLINITTINKYSKFNKNNCSEENHLNPLTTHRKKGLLAKK